MAALWLALAPQHQLSTPSPPLSPTMTTAVPTADDGVPSPFLGLPRTPTRHLRNWVNNRYPRSPPRSESWSRLGGVAVCPTPMSHCWPAAQTRALFGDRVAFLSWFPYSVSWGQPVVCSPASPVDGAAACQLLGGTIEPQPHGRQALRRGGARCSYQQASTAVMRPRRSCLRVEIALDCWVPSSFLKFAPTCWGI